MSEKTAEDVISFITRHCGESKKVFLSWFGGEPTVAANRISQICMGLKANGIEYYSDITTNGYLLGEEMINLAKSLWNLQTVNISMDGTEKNYNSSKNYKNISPTISPYKIVMENIKCLQNRNIYVNMRMNFDIKNHQDFGLLIQEIKQSFLDVSHFSLTAHPVIGAHVDYDGDIQHGTSSWFSEKIYELNNKARIAGLNYRKSYLPFIKYRGCQACSDSAITITPDGNLVRCPEQFSSNQFVGNVNEGIIHYDIHEGWKAIADYEKCRECVFYPWCFRLINCGVQDRCEYKMELQKQTECAITDAVVKSR